MFPANILIPAEVLKQKLARRTKRPESAKLSDRTGRAKVRKTQCESLNMAPLAWSKKWNFDPRLAFKAKVEAVINCHLGVRGNGSS